MTKVERREENEAVEKHSISSGFPGILETNLKELVMVAISRNKLM